MTLRCGIIGAGQIAWRYDGGHWDGRHSLTHASCFGRHNDTQLVAVFDPVSQSRAAFIDDYKGPVPVAVTDNLDDFFSHDLDLVAIASPTQHHLDHVLACLNAKIDYLWIEKPVTLTLKSFDIIRNVLQGVPNQPRCCVNYFRRALPQVEALKSHIQKSTSLSGCEIVYSRRLDVNGVHLLDLLGYLFDACAAPDVIWVQTDVSGKNPSFGLNLNGVPITVTGHDLPYHLIELRVTDSMGRMSLTRGGAALVWEKAVPNPDYPEFSMILPPTDVLAPAESQSAMREGLFLMLTNLVDPTVPALSTLDSAYFAQSLLEQVTNLGGMK